jgi:hypothetical protein
MYDEFLSAAYSGGSIIPVWNVDGVAVVTGDILVKTEKIAGTRSFRAVQIENARGVHITNKVICLYFGFLLCD